VCAPFWRHLNIIIQRVNFVLDEYFEGDIGVILGILESLVKKEQQ
tara:strand:+ start:625 stop:759 length:135 start_codon:yes stop_codon:yes gene_type:complete